MKKKNIAMILIVTSILIILSTSSPALESDTTPSEENKVVQSDDIKKSYFLSKINISGNATVTGSMASFPGVGGEIKLFNATILIDITFDGIESTGNTTIKPFLGLFDDEIHLNGSHQLNIWCLWGTYSVPPLGTTGPTQIEGTALLVKIL